MTTHEIARMLTQLAKALREGPDVDLAKVESLLRNSLTSDAAGRIAVNLSTLVELARIDKQQWQAFIRTYDFPIEARPRDASRDILGKLLRYLEENPDARRRLRATLAHKGAQTSPELARALAALMKE